MCDATEAFQVFDFIYFCFFLKVDFHPRRRCRTVSAVLTRNDESEDSDLCSEISNIEDRDWEPDEEKQDDYISDSDDSPEVDLETSVMSSVIDYVDLQESKVKKGVVLQAPKMVREKTRNNKLNCCQFSANTIQEFPGIILNVITEKVKWLGYCHFRKDHFKGNNFGLNL